jgi:hypothetical protein
LMKNAVREIFFFSPCILDGDYKENKKLRWKWVLYLIWSSVVNFSDVIYVVII